MNCPPLTCALARGCSPALLLALLCMAVPRASAQALLHVSGRLVDAHGAPVSRAKVGVVCIGALPNGPPLDCGFPGMSGRLGTTRADGTFRLERLPAARYSLFAALEPSAGQEGALPSEALMALTLDRSLEGVELRLELLLPLAGVVLDGAGTPVADAQVSAQVESKESASPVVRNHSRGSARTDAQGRFRIKTLGDAPYRVEVSKQGYIRQQLEATVRPGQPPLTLTLKRCATVRGRAVRPDGSPVEGLQVDGRSSRLPDGHFEEFSCSDRPELRLRLTAKGMAQHARLLKLQSEQVLELGDLRMEPARSLHVRVTDKASGAPVQWASVEVEDPEPHSVHQTKADGEVVVGEYPDGDLELKVRAHGFLATRVSVKKGQTDLAVALDPGQQLTGRALDAEGKPQLGSAQVSCSGGGGGSAMLDAQGGFRVQGLGGGVCTVSFQVITSPFPTFDQHLMVWVEPGKPLHVEFKPPPVRHPLHVRLEGAGKPRRAMLFAGDVPAQADLKGLAMRSLIPQMEGMPEMAAFRAGKREEGGFRFRDVGPGRYTLVVILQEGVFRAPLTQGEEEATLSVSIPATLAPPVP